LSVSKAFLSLLFRRMNPSVLSLPLSLNDSNQEASSKSTTTFNVDQRNAVVHIYNILGCNEGAVKLIKSFDGYKDLNGRRIKRWMKNPDVKNPGRPISEEFEDEVIAECELSTTHKKNQLSTTSNRFSYILVKECALKVFNRDYWNVKESSFIKKWHTDPRTSKLHFSNKWVVGLLQRDLKKRPVVESPIVYEEQAVETIVVHEEQEVELSETVFENSLIDSYHADSSFTAPPSFVDCLDPFIVDNDLEDLLSENECFNRDTTSLSNQSLDDDLQKLLEFGFDFSAY